MTRLRTVRDIVDWRLCLGCGACAYICPDDKVELVDVFDEGFRPVVENSHCGSCTECLQVCPAFDNDHTEINRRTRVIPELVPYVGPVLEVWEGHASDADIRFQGSSGGLITALSLYCLEKQNMHGVLHIGSDSSDATRNCTKMSRTRQELLEKTGSRYAAAAACDSLHLIESAPKPCVFIGQPSEVTALRKAQQLRPALAKKVGLAISFFCAGSPARKGTVELLKSMGVDPEKAKNIRYRGNGWPGMFAVTVKGDSAPSRFRKYAESWGFLQSYRPLSTHLCPDGTGEDADISCGDPWHRKIQTGEPGSSLAVVRTEAGRAIIREAISAGYVELQPAEPWKVLQSQKNLVEKRGAVAGRVAILRSLGLPAPRLRGFFLLHNWLKLSFSNKLRSTLGTLRRVIGRKYFRRKQIFASPASSSTRSSAQHVPDSSNLPVRGLE